MKKKEENEKIRNIEQNGTKFQSVVDSGIKEERRVEVSGCFENCVAEVAVAGYDLSQYQTIAERRSQIIL